MYNKNLGMKYYSKIEDAPLSEILRQEIIKTENQLMVFYDSIWKGLPYTGISKGAYILFYHGGTIYHCTPVKGKVSQYSADSAYNVSCTSVMAISHSRMINNELLNKDPNVVP